MWKGILSLYDIAGESVTNFIRNMTPPHMQVLGLLDSMNPFVHWTKMYWAYELSTPSNVSVVSVLISCSKILPWRKAHGGFCSRLTEREPHLDFGSWETEPVETFFKKAWGLLPYPLGTWGTVLKAYKMFEMLKIIASKTENKSHQIEIDA